jgi:signal peptidase I
MIKEASTVPAFTRRPSVAALLSALAPGLGHVYAGRLLPGIVWLGAYLALGSIGTLVVMVAPSVHGVLVVAAAGLGLWIVAAVQAWRAARAVPTGASSAEYQRWYVYVTLALLALPGSASWALAVRERVVQVFSVPSGSMLPAITPSDRVWVNRLAYRTGPVHRGDVVVFVNPNARHACYVKRVVALPGDRIEMRADEVFVNGVRLEHSPEAGSALWEANAGARYRIVLLPPSTEPRPPTTFAPITVPNGHCFVLGDNRRRSEDSRQYGPVPLVDVIGRVDRVW